MPGSRARVAPVDGLDRQRIVLLVRVLPFGTSCVAGSRPSRGAPLLKIHVGRAEALIMSDGVKRAPNVSQYGMLYL